MVERANTSGRPHTRIGGNSTYIGIYTTTESRVVLIPSYYCQYKGKTNSSVDFVDFFTYRNSYYRQIKGSTNSSVNFVDFYIYRNSYDHQIEGNSNSFVNSGDFYI